MYPGRQEQVKDEGWKFSRTLNIFLLRAELEVNVAKCYYNIYLISVSIILFCYLLHILNILLLNFKKEAVSRDKILGKVKIVY